MSYGVVYKITNTVNGKVYVGQTTETPARRWSRHCHKSKKRNSALPSAILKYGKAAFTTEVVGFGYDKDHLDDAEKYFVSLYNCVSPNGYNLTDGGNSAGSFAPETRAKISAFHKKRWANPEARSFQLKAMEAWNKSEANMEVLRVARDKSFSAPGYREKNLTQILSEVEKKMIPVGIMHVETLEIYEFRSKAEAARFLDASPTDIDNCLARKQNAVKGHIVFTVSRSADGAIIAPSVPSKFRVRNRPVVLISENGERSTFENTKQAAGAIGRSAAAVSAALGGRYPTVAGFRAEYAPLSPRKAIAKCLI